MTTQAVETNSEAVTVLPDGRMDTKNAARYVGLKAKWVLRHE